MNKILECERLDIRKEDQRPFLYCLSTSEDTSSDVKMEGFKQDEVASDDEFLREWAEPLDSKEDQKLNIDIGEGKDGHGHEVASDDAFHRQWAEPLDCKDDKKFNFAAEDVKEEERHGTCPDAKIEADVSISTVSNDMVEKKHRTKGQLCQTATMKMTDSIIRKLCQNAPITDQFVSKCKFKCPSCDKGFNTWNALGKHSRICDVKLSAKDVAEYIVKVVCHVCRICSERVLSDTDFMDRHFINHHRISLGNFKKKFVLNQLKKLPENAYSNNVIGNFCSYKCKGCEEQFDQRPPLIDHMKATSHGMNFKGQVNMIKAIYHKCKICDNVILCDIIVLRRHFKARHSLTIDEYCQKTGCIQAEKKEKKETLFLNSLKVSESVDNLCIFTCGICNKSNKSVYELKKHRMQSKHYVKRKTQSLTTLLLKGFAYKCKICSKLMLCDKTVIQRHMIKNHEMEEQEWPHKTKQKLYEEYLAFCKSSIENEPVSAKVNEKVVVPSRSIPIKETSSTIGNLSQFFCPQCKSKFHSWQALGRHCKNSHTFTIHFDKSLVLTARYHPCLLCNEAILSDRTFIRWHLRCKHKITLAKYENTFLKHGGKTVPRFRKWLNQRREAK